MFRVWATKGGGEEVWDSLRVQLSDHVISREPATESRDVFRVWATKGGGEEVRDRLRVQLSVHHS